MKLKKKLDSAPEHIPLPSSSEEDEEDQSQSDLSDEEHNIEDPFRTEEDSDEAPEAVSFTSAKLHLQKMKLLQKHANEVIKIYAEEKRRKRKELHEELLKQREEKKRKIEDKRLPDDVLENLNDDPDHQSHTSDDESKEFQDNDDNDTLKNENPSIDEIIEEHGSSVFKCKILKDKTKHLHHAPESFEKWKSQFGISSHIRREKSTKDAVLKIEKCLASRHRS